MTTCHRFDRDPVADVCRTCGRAVYFTHTTRRMPGSGDGIWRHVGDDVAGKLRRLDAERKAGAR